MASVPVLRLAPFLVAVGSASGCGLLLGTDEYTVSSARDAGGGGAAGAAPGCVYAGGNPLEAAFNHERARAVSPEECAACVQAECPAEATACVESPECRSIMTCGACAEGPWWDPTVSCLPYVEGQSVADWATSNVPALTFFNCRKDNCFPACDDAEPYGCAGKFEWPASSSGIVAMTVQLGPSTDVAEPDADVRACERQRSTEPDDECRIPLGSPQTTDERGVAVLQIPPTTGGSQIGVSIAPRDVFLDVPGTDAWHHSHVYVNRPWYADTSVALFIPTFPKADLAPVVSGTVFNCTGTNLADGLEVSLTRDDGLPGGTGTTTFGWFHIATEPPESSTMGTLTIREPVSGTTVVSGFRFPIQVDVSSHMILWPDAK